MPYKDPEKRKQASKERGRRLLEKNPNYHREYGVEYGTRPEVKQKRRLQAVKRYYNPDADVYLKMILDQDNKCFICNKSETHTTKFGDVRPLNVDHDHATGKVRALLCTNCNAALGNVNDNIEILEKCIAYLKQFKDN